VSATRGKFRRIATIGAAALVATVGLGASGLEIAGLASAGPTPSPITQYFAFPGPTGFAQLTTVGQAGSPTSVAPGANFTIANPGGSQVVPTLNSGVAVNYISGNAQYYEIPTGATYVSAVAGGPLSWTGGSGAGGIPASGTAPVVITECTSSSQTGCTASPNIPLSSTAGTFTGFGGPNPTFPYLEVSTGTTQIPAGSTLTLPTVTVTLTASGTAGTVLNWSQFEFDTVANVTLFGSHLNAAVVGYPSALYSGTLPAPVGTTIPYAAPPVLTSTTIAASSTAPGAPTIGTATAGNAQATVTWTAPASTGGSAITGYTVTSTPGGKTASAGAGATTATVTGLTNGTAYTFAVTATNAIGTGAPSAASNSVTPAASSTAPGAPTIGTATAGNAQATVTWTAPASTGGSAITGYTVTSTPGGKTASAGAGATTATVTGLTNGTAYTFAVTATNAIGTGAPSAASNSVTPASAPVAPGAPTIGTATGGDAQATVTWTAPASTGGSPITSYTVTSAPGSKTATALPGVTTATVTGLTNGTAYTFTVTATNLIGTSPASAASNSVTPAAAPIVPGAPTTQYFAFPGPTGFAQVTTVGQANSPASVTSGANFTIANPGGSQAVPTTNSGVPVNYISGNAQYYEIPTGATYVSSSATGPLTWTGGPGTGGIPAAGSAPVTITLCTAAGQTGCTAAQNSPLVADSTTATFSGFAGPNPTYPYLEVSTGTTKIPAGSTLTLPEVDVVLTASGVNGTTLKWSQFEFDTNANVTLFGSAITAAVVGYPSALYSGTLPVTTAGIPYAAPPVLTSTTIGTVTATAPTFTADTPPTTGTVGTAYTYTFAATGAPAPTFAVATGTLPAGLTLNATSGVLSGTPTTAGPSTFTVSAHNTTAPDAVSASITITVAAGSGGTLVAPGAPTIGTATGGDAQATVTWTAPASTGGSPITSYTVTSAPGSKTATALPGVTTATVTGLTNGTAYTFTVTATNLIGTSPASAASNSVTPAAAPIVPGAPTTQYFAFPGPTGFAQVTTVGQANSPASVTSGANFTIANPGGSQAVPTTNSGVPVNYISGNAQYYEIPTGATYVSSSATGPLTWTGGPGTGGIPAAGSAPVTITLCTAAGQTGCTAAQNSPLVADSTTATFSGFAGPNPTYPYLEVSTGTTKIPAGSTLTLPEVDVVLTASGVNGTTLKWSQFEFDTNANVTLFGSAITAAVVGYPSALYSGTLPVTTAGIPYAAPPVLTSTTIGTVTATAPTFTADTPPTTGTVGTAYTYTFAATGAPAPTFAVATGTLPAGLTLNATSGVLSGTPTTAGPSTFTVSAHNTTAPDAVSGSITITVAAATAAAPTFTADTPPATGTVGTDYTYTFAASGTPAPTFAVASGTLPAGLTLDSTTGVLSGKPTNSGASTFTVSAHNATAPDAVSGPITVTISATGPNNPVTLNFATFATGVGWSITSTKANWGASGQSVAYGSNFDFVSAASTQVIPTQQSIANVNFITQTQQIYPLPAGTTFVKAVAAGPGTYTGGPASNPTGSFPLAVTYCTAPSANCTASTSSSTNFLGSTPGPYVEIGLGSAQIPGGATLNLPAVTVTLTGTSTETVTWVESEFQTTANVDIPSLHATNLTIGPLKGYPTAATTVATAGPAPALLNPPPTLASIVVTPPAVVAVPGAPTLDSVTAGNASATLVWTPPASNGGGPITGYVITPSTGSPVTVGNVTTYTVTGLTNGTPYTFTVAAINSAGTGPPSAALQAVTPSATPVVAAAAAHPVTTAATSGGSSSLPFTGADLGKLLVMGSAAMVLGGLLMLRRRRRTA